MINKNIMKKETIIKVGLWALLPIFVTGSYYSLKAWQTSNISKKVEGVLDENIKEKQLKKELKKAYFKLNAIKQFKFKSWLNSLYDTKEKYTKEQISAMFSDDIADIVFKLMPKLFNQPVLKDKEKTKK